MTWRQPIVPGFDPFLQDVKGAEVRLGPSPVKWATESADGRELTIGTPAGELFLARFVCTPMSLLLPEGAPRPEIGDLLAITDHRGFRYVGFRAQVLAVDGPRVSLLQPMEALFFPGRQHRRLEGVLGAQLTVEFRDEIVPARGLDLSLGGLGMVVPDTLELERGETLTVHLRFEGETLSLPVVARSVRAERAQLRIGVEFATHSESLARRIRAAIERS